jgi:L-ascorbate metabolism protein UlaG (beta-lactamase superfamily)
MQITWKGQSCFQIITTGNKNNQALIAIDPFLEETGLRFPKLEADILLITNKTNTNPKAVSGNPFLIENPGEYEIKEVFIQGISAGEKNTIYTIEAEGIHLCHLGNLNQKELTAEQLEKIGDTDILMIPIGGVYTISVKEATEIMSQIEPKIIIPMNYQIPKLNPPAGGKLDTLDKFLKALGIKHIEPLNKLSIKKRDFSEEEVKIVILKP